MKSQKPTTIHIDGPGVVFPVLTDTGFGQIEVKLEPGQSETIEIHGKTYIIVRDQVH